MLSKLSLWAFATMMVSGPNGSAVGATSIGSPSLLRAGDNHHHTNHKQEEDPATTNNAMLLQMQQLLERVEALETSNDYLEATVHNQEMRIDELDETVEMLRSQQEQEQHHHRNLGVDSRCDIIFENGVCRANNTFAFNFDVAFDGDVQANRDLKVRRDFETMGPAMLTRGAEIYGGLITLDSRLTFGNITIDGLNIVGKTIFNDPIEVLDKAAFSNEVDFIGDEKVEFNVDVTFREDVYFKDDVEFQDDVAIMGPDTSDDSSDSSIDFEIMGYVNVDFKQKKAMDVYPETRFRDDVHLVQGSSTSDHSSDSSTSTSSSDESGEKTTSDSSKSSSDYSSDSHDHAPMLRVEGDVTAESDLKVEGDLHVHGGTTLTGTTTFKSNLLVDGGNVEILEQDPVDDDLVPLGGDLLVGGSTTLFGGISGGLTINDGDLDVAAGNLAVAGNSALNTVTGTNEGELVVPNGLRVTSPTTQITLNGDVQIVGSGADALTVGGGNTQLNGDLSVSGTINPPPP